ncbi:MAG: 1-deoxy-D-xylulose-5-phosphate synthase [Bacteroidetes bacterium]|nr:1-deoxy-D-xylulose-5-phosphate synthase [Bacteroidota bacterium]
MNPHFPYTHPEQLKSLTIQELQDLAGELRAYLVSTILHSGGHFAGNLGVVELTLALLSEYNLPYDSVIWDVGHQSYIHKILTGRYADLPGIRSLNGISGFPKMEESVFDAFGTGHSSTSVSAGLGMAVAARLQGETEKRIAVVVGDGALTGGMAFEALNNLAASQANLLVIVNDNHMGIDPNTGAMDRHLQHISESAENIFQNLGLDYFGPVDGHDLNTIKPLIRSLRKKEGPQVLHIRTTKGKGYAPAEAEQTLWHSAPQFVKINPGENPARKWQDAFGDCLMNIADLDEKVVGITPAMPSGSGMVKLMEKYPHRFFDVGIAEQHAVTFAAGLAAGGNKPFLNIYSTFLQRGYDQLIHDVALQKLPVVFCIDRAGLVGEDGPTHHGSFDIAFLQCIPNMLIAAPADEPELQQLMKLAPEVNLPFAIRYPKGSIPAALHSNALQFGKGICLQKGSHTAIISTGLASQFCHQALNACEGTPSHYHFPFIKPLDTDLLDSIFSTHSHIITAEDGCISGGFGMALADYSAQNKYMLQFTHAGIPDEFISHGNNNELYEMCGYSPQRIVQMIHQIMKGYLPNSESETDPEA